MGKFLLILISFSALQVFAGPADSESIEVIPQESKILFEPRFIVRAYTGLTKVGFGKEGKHGCFFQHDQSARERILPAELQVSRVTSRSYSSGSPYTQRDDTVYYHVIEFIKMESRLTMICIFPYVSGETFSIGQLRDILSSGGGSLTFSDPIEF